MSATGLDVFDKTLQTTHIWLDELMQDERSAPTGRSPGTCSGWSCARCATAFRWSWPCISARSCRCWCAASTMTSGMRPGRIDEKPRSLDAFLEPIGERLNQIRPMDARVATGAVFTVLSRHVDPGQAEKVRHALPGEVQALWPAAATWVEVERDRAGGSAVAAGGGRA